jgi:hypothetical protein
VFLKLCGFKYAQAGTLEGLSKDPANGRSAAPVSPTQSCYLELTAGPQFNASSWEERVIMAPQLLFSGVGNPSLDNPAYFLAYGKEVHRERLTKFRLISLAS